MKRIPELDGIRGLAILTVLLWHCIAPRMDLSLDWSLQIMKCLNLSWTGVDLFFVLSGFLIGGILLDHGRANNFFRVFYARRALRILPPYCLLLLSYLVAKTWLAPGKPPGAAGLLIPSPPMWIYGTFLQNFYFAGTGASGTPWLSATWSLAVEEQFYLCLPLVVFLVPRTRLAPLLLGLIAAAPLFRILFYDLPPVPGFADYVLMPGRSDALLIGVLSAWLVRHEPARNWLNVHPRWLGIALLVLLAGVLVLHQSYLGYISFSMMAVGYTWLALFYGCLILVAVTATRGVVRTITRFPPLRYLGNISYSLYLMHIPVSTLIYEALTAQSDKVHSGSDALAMVLALLAPILLAAISWHLMEKPLIRLGHSLRYRFGR